MDRRVQDFIFALPREQRVNGGWLKAFCSKAKTKYLLKYGMGPKVLPEEVIVKNKGGFTPPLVDWYKRTLCNYTAEQLLSPALKEAGIFQISFIDRMIREHREGTKNWTTLLFMIFTFDLWFQHIVKDMASKLPQESYSDILARQNVHLDF